MKGKEMEVKDEQGSQMCRVSVCVWSSRRTEVGGVTCFAAVVWY